MTIDRPGPGLRIPQWAAEVGVLLFVALVSYVAATLRATELTTEQFAVRMDTSEKDRASIHAELETMRRVQEQNSEFREAAKVKFEEIDDIKQLLVEHMQKESQNWQRHTGPDRK
jgi:hypothetical protein